LSLAPSTQPPPGRLQKLLQLGSIVLAAGYLLALLAVAVVLPLVGERWWVTTALLYLPRFGFGLPLPVVILALALFGPRRLLWALPVPLLVLLFPIMGLRLGLGAMFAPGEPGRPVVRLLSYNVAATDDPAEVVEAIRSAAPDVVVIQEHTRSLEEALGTALPGFARHSEGQFAIASRYPIEDVYLPPTLEIPGLRPRSARFVRYRLKTPLGPVHVYNVHPVSPRNGLEEARGDGLLHSLKQGRLGDSEGIRRMMDNSVLRQRQVETFAADAARSPHPVVIAGDTNLPDGSFILRRALGGFSDGFARAGRGFGYTYPADRPWMRIDRILTDGRLAIDRFRVLPRQGSDHRAVVAELRLK
jgi:vancomycin resistance protein VanJ